MCARRGRTREGLLGRDGKGGTLAGGGGLSAACWWMWGRPVGRSRSSGRVGRGLERERVLQGSCELEPKCEGTFKVKLRKEDSIWLGWEVFVKVFELETRVSNLPRKWRWELGKQGDHLERVKWAAFRTR